MEVCLTLWPVPSDLLAGCGRCEMPCWARRFPGCCWQWRGTHSPSRAADQSHEPTLRFPRCWLALRGQTGSKVNLVFLRCQRSKSNHSSTLTCPHPLPSWCEGGTAHNDVLADGAVIVIATTPTEFYRRVCHVLHNQTTRRAWGAWSAHRLEPSYRFMSQETKTWSFSYKYACQRCLSWL